MSCGRVLIYGGRGALGSKCVGHFKKNDFWVGSVDFKLNTEADLNVVLERNQNPQVHLTAIECKLKEALQGSKLDAIICVAGGWAGGNAAKDLAKVTELMWKQSVCSSMISAALASVWLKEDGLLSLTGAQAALKPTPSMVGYGMAKSTVHQLVKSLGSTESGLPSGVVVAAILPNILDTAMNRKWMPQGDFAQWTSLDFVAELLLGWTVKRDRPETGSLCQLETRDSVTRVVM